MAISNSTAALLRTQYYDDWYTTSNTDPRLTRGEEFDFHRILFRPRYPVQSRELIQLQTILQEQVARYGRSAFRNGEAVLGGGLTLDVSVTGGKTLPASNVAAMFDRDTNEGKYIFDPNDTSLRAHVLQFMAADEDDVGDNFLIFKYQTGGTFSPSVVVQAADDAQITATFAAGSQSEVFTPASIISIDEGVFFVSGFFVRVKKQSIVLTPFSARPNYRIGLEINEEVLDELDDVVGETLLDPTNQAPGGHRLRIRLVLAKRSLSSSADANFIELARVIDGQLQQIKKAPRFVRIDELNEILARRTHDESGDYIVRPFAPVLEADEESDEHFVFSLGPGKAYVRGFEVETSEPTKLQVRKGRETQAANNRNIPTRVGNFVYAIRVAASAPSNYFANTAVVDLHCANVASIDVTSSTTYNYSRIGQAKIRMVETFSVPTDPSLGANNSIYKLFFYDVQYDNLTGNLTSAAANGLYVTATAAVANGVPNVNGALEGATVVLGGNDSPVTGTFTISSYVVSAGVASITFAEYMPTFPDANTTYKFLFQSRDIDAFALFDAALTSTQAPYASKLSFQADVDARSKISGTPVGNTIISDTNNNTLIFPIPEKFPKANSITTDTALFTSWVKTTSNAQLLAASNTNYTLTVSGTALTLPTGNLSATAAQQALIIFDQTADANGRGRILQFADTPGSARCISNVAISAAGSDYNITFTMFNTPAGTTRSLVGLARATVVGLAPRTKTLMLGNTTHAVANTNDALESGQVEFHSLNVTPGFTYSLKVPDVFRISKILYKDSNTTFSNTDISTATDVTEYFTLDDGQRDNTYEYGGIVATRTTGRVVRPTGRLLVIFDWFKHEGRGYVTLDSYLSTLNVTRGMTYDLIPSYTSAKFGNAVFSLRDVLDFRPARAWHNFVGAPAVFSADDAGANNTYLTATAESYLTPVSDEEWLGSYEYYLGRIDKIAVGFDGTFRVIEGQDASKPTAPVDETGSLLLFQLTVPPYTLVDANDVPTTVRVQTFNHKRFTMSDLSKIDDRVSHLEYYTALNSLERITRDQAVLDADGNERFKNGMLVDSFYGADVADVGRLDYTASIDLMKREMRTAFRTFVMQFAPDVTNSTSTGVTVIGDMAIPSYSVAAFITQPLASHAVSVNPFDVASFYGTVSLLPAVDIWKDVDQAPAQVIDLGGPSQAWIDANQPSFTTWGEWEQTWSGVTSVQPRAEFMFPPGWTEEVHPIPATLFQWQDVETTTNFQRQGTAFEFEVQTTNASLGNQIIDVSVVHRMRARDVIFAADGMKPNANIYAFFDGTNVDDYIQQANVLELDPVDLGTAAPVFVGQTVYIRKAITGTVASTSGSAAIVGTDSKFEFELVEGQLVRVTQGVNSFDAFVDSITSNTALTLASNASNTLAAATLYTLTPVTVASVAPRTSGDTIIYSVKVVRARRDADVDSVVPYTITAGPVRPEKHVNDAADTTSGALLLIPNSPRASAASYNVASALVKSGVVRRWDSGSAEMRFDTDITDSQVEIGTVIHFVSGPGAGTSAEVVSYETTTQTAVLNDSDLDIVAGETIYSVGLPKTDGLISGGLAQGRAGTLSGVFHIPAGRFAVGSRTFRLTDQANNDVSLATTAAEFRYEASGITYTQRETSVSSRSLGLRRAGPRTESLSFTDRSQQNFDAQYVDPLAQTFLVDAKEYPQGIFLTSLDLCFASVPEDDIPVTVQIRTVVNGYPSSNQIVPCVSETGIATVTLRPDQVNVTTAPSFDTSTVYTRFTFAAPVHLLPGREYAVVVMSDSNEYHVYTAELGKTVIGQDAVIAKQPYAGSFFKSQNAQTWTESPFEDMMFRLNRARWNAGPEIPLTGLIVTRAVAPNTNTTFDSIEFYPHEVQFSDETAASYNIDIKPLNVATDDLTDSIAVRYTPRPNEWQPLASRAMAQGQEQRILPFPVNTQLTFANTVDVTASLTTWSPDVAPFIDLKKMNLLCVRHLINDMGLANTDVVVLNPGAGYLANLQSGLISTTGGSPVVTGDGNTNFSTAIVAGDTVVVGGNLEIVVASVTNTSEFVATANVSATRAANTFWRYGEANGNNTVALTIADGNGNDDAEGYAIVGPDGKISGVVITEEGSGYTGDPTLTVVAPEAPGGDYDVDQSTAVLSYVSELDPMFGNGLTRYITRPVVLADGFDARDIVVYFDAYRPQGSKFYVYYKVLSGDNDTERFDDQNWRLMEQETPDDSVSTHYHQFKEFKFKTPESRALDSSDDSTDKFKVWAIKVVMASDSTVLVPRICNLRAIALDQ